MQSRYRRCPVCSAEGYQGYFQWTRAYWSERNLDAGYLDFLFSEGRDSIHIVRCASCGMCYVRDFYDVHLVTSRDMPLTTEGYKTELRNQDIAQYLFKSYLAQMLMRLIVVNNKAEVRVLDYGSAYAATCMRIANFYPNARCTAYDPHVESGDVEGIRFENQLSRLYETGPYDGIICKEVLEHCLDPGAELGHINKLLHQGGYAYLSVPLFDYGQLEKYKRYNLNKGYARKEFHPGHLNYFSIGHFARLIKETGFEIAPAQLDFTAYRTPHPCDNAAKQLFWGFGKAVRYLGFRAILATGAYVNSSRFFLPGFFVRKKR